MFRTILIATGAMIAAIGGPARAADFDAPAPIETPFLSRFYVHVGPAALIQNQGVKLELGGVPVRGADIGMKWNPTLGIEAGAYLTPNIAVSFTGGLPPVGRVEAAGALDGIGRLGETRYGPMALTAHYHFNEMGSIRPYIGAGAVYMYVFSTTDAAINNLDVKNAFGAAAQVGVDMMFTNHWGMIFDLKKAYLRTEATGSFLGAPVKADLKLDPVVLNSGVTYRF
jgi:outer membrane protein